MSYQEQRSIVTMVSGIAILAIFLSRVIPRYHALDPGILGDGFALLRWAATAMLVFIGVSIVGRIIILILHSIVYTAASGEQPPSRDDERDRQIQLKTDQISQTIFILGFVASLIVVLTGAGPVAMLLYIALGGLLAELVSESARIIFYRRGF